jgi:hypothetical protein
MKIRPVTAELFDTDGRTDMTKLIIAFRNFANSPENEWKTLFLDYINQAHKTREMERVRYFMCDCTKLTTVHH